LQPPSHPLMTYSTHFASVQSLKFLPRHKLAYARCTSQ
jgi:hypothetical protein